MVLQDLLDVRRRTGRTRLRDTFEKNSLQRREASLKAITLNIMIL